MFTDSNTSEVALMIVAGSARQSHLAPCVEAFQLSWKFQKSMKIRTRCTGVQ
jgi:hypothetical protein